VLHHNKHLRIPQRVDHFFQITCSRNAPVDRPSRTARIDATGDIQTFIERRTHNRLAAATNEVQRRNRLNLFANPHATTAKNAFLGSRMIETLELSIYAGSSHPQNAVPNTQLFGQGLQFTNFCSARNTTIIR